MWLRQKFHWFGWLSEPDEKMQQGYDAFLSYSHRSNSRFAKSLQWILEHFGSPLPLRRRMRVFRDETNLAANPDLWGNIETALQRSGAFLLLASPAAANSPWVVKELEQFLTTKGSDRLCILLIAGTTPWTDPGTETNNSAIPSSLVTRLNELQQVPLVVDLRDFVEYRPWRLRFEDEFLGKAASVVAAVLGREKDEIFGAHIRAQRYSIAALGLIAAAFAVVGLIALAQNRLAERRLDQAVDVAERVHMVVDRRLEEVAGAAAARQELLNSSGALLDRLLGEARDNGNVLYQRMTAYVHEGDLALEKGESEKAETAYEIAGQIGRRLERLEPVNREWQRYLSVVLDRIGDLQADRGKLEHALETYEQGRQISERIAQVESPGAREMRDLSVSYSKTGTIRERMGEMESAAKAYGREVEIARRLLQKDPSDTKLLHDLHGALHRAGSLDFRLGKVASGLEQLNEARAIIEHLSAGKPDNALFQRDLAANLATLGVRQEEQGQHEEALTAYRQSLAVEMELRRREPGNADWAGRVARTLSLIGDVERAMGHLDDAIRNFKESESILEALLEENAKSLTLTTDLMRTRLFMGKTLVQRGDRDEALALFENICKKLEKSVLSRGGIEQADILSTCLEQLSSIYIERGQLDQAESVAQRDVELSEWLLAQTPESYRIKFNLAASLSTLGDMQTILGEREAAMHTLARVREIVEAVARTRGWNRQLALGAGRTLSSVGLSLERIEESNEAYESYARALQLITFDDPNEEEQAERALVLQRLCAIDLMEDRLQEAENRCTEAHRLLAPLYASASDNVELVHNMAAVLTTLGDVQHYTGLLVEALRLYEQSRTLLETLLSDNDLNAVQDLSAVFERLGLVNKERGLDQPALDAFQRSLELSQQLLQAYSNDILVRRGVAISLKHLADLHLSHRRLDLARDHYEQLLQFATQFPELNDLGADARIGLGELAWKEGDRVSALEVFETALKAKEEDAALNQDDTSRQDALRTVIDLVAEARSNQGDLDGAWRLRQRSVEIAQQQVTANEQSVFYRQALSASLFSLGSLELARGRTTLAMEAFERAREIDEEIVLQEPDSTENRSDLAITLSGLAEVHIARGEKEQARALIDRMLEIRQHLVDLVPNQEPWQRALAASFDMRGDLLKDQYDLVAAMADYRKSLAIREDLLSRRSDDPARIRLVSLSLERIGGIQVLMDEADLALTSFQRTLALRRDLIDTPGDVGDPYHDISVTLRQLGNLYLNRGDLEKAQEAFTEAQNLMQAGVKKGVEDAPPVMQRELAAILERVGAVHAQQGNFEAARNIYEQAYRISKHLVELDPTNIGWRGDLTAYTEAIGDAQLALGKDQLARKRFESVLQERNTILISSPKDVHTRRSLAVTLNKLGDVAHNAGELGLAQARYEQSRDEITAVSRIDPDNATWRSDLGFTEQRLATLGAHRDAWGEALSHGVDALTSYQLASELDPNNTSISINLVTAFNAVDEYLTHTPAELAQWELTRLFTRASLLHDTYPGSAKILGTLAAALAFDSLRIPQLAEKMCVSLSDVYQDDLVVLGCLAELALAQWGDPAHAREIIARYSSRVETLPMRIVAHSFELASAVLDGDQMAMRMASTSLMEAAEQLSEQTHLGSFTGLRTELARRDHPSKEALLTLFDLLEVDEPVELRAKLGRLIEKEGWNH